MITVLFLYRPVDWCFLRGMKKAKIILVASIVIAAVLIKTQTNLWRTEVVFFEDGSKHYEYPYVNGELHGTQIRYNEDGSKSQEIVYENGKEISRKDF